MKTFPLLIAAAIAAPAALAQEPPGQKFLAAEGGRFVFGQVNDTRADQYMLDTKTGKLWQVVQATRPGSEASLKSTYLTLQPVVYRDSQGNETPTATKSLDEGFGEYLKANPKK